MAEHVLTESGIYGIRLMAADLIREATERGDLDQEAVTWAAIRMLQRANDSEARTANAARRLCDPSA